MSLLYLPAEFHLHTVLSACAEIEMIPPLIIRQAQRLGIQWLAVTDHNSAENARAVMEAGARAGIVVLPGMEVQTREEVHLLCLFEALEPALAWQEQVYQHLPDLPNREETFGSQLVVDAEGTFLRFQERLLQTSTSLSVEQVVTMVEALGGLVIPAHVDRPAFSLLANLGIIPPGLNIPAVEITPRLTPAQALERFPQLAGRALITNGDAHRLSVAAPTLAELRRALAGVDGRKVWVT
jgi:PHP family Zn ribbon phosphoesterase